MSRLASIVGAALLSLVLAPAAHAQLVGLKHVWTVPGMQNNANFGTVFACTNSGTASQAIGVDLYGAAGAYVDADSLSVAPQSTVLIGTNAVPGTSIDLNISAPVITKGHARVYATTSKGVLCSAYLVDLGSVLPAVSLSAVKTFKQKGD